MSQPAEGEPRPAPGSSQGQPRQEPTTRPAHRSRSLLRESAAVLVTAIVLSLLIKTVLVQAFFIPSESMEPTLHGCETCVGDRVLVNKLTTHTGGVHRGDIVVFHDPGGWLPQASSTSGLQSRVHDALAIIGLAPSSNDSDLIKRIIGVGGDTVEGRGGQVYVNGAQLKEPYVFPGNSPSKVDFRVTVPFGKLWVMGDHRSNSSDSRFHMQDPGNGFVPMKDVVGRAFVIVWPLGRVGSLDTPATFDRLGVSAAR